MDADPEVWAAVEQMILSEIVSNTDQVLARDKSLALPSAPSGEVTPNQQERGNAKCLIAMQGAPAEGCEDKGS